MPRGAVMDTVHFTIRTPWLLRALGGNPLVRGSDRVEAAITAVLAVLVILALPVAAAVGVAVHESQTTYLTEALATRHQIAAEASGDSTPATEPGGTTYLTSVRWVVGNQVYDDVVSSRDSHRRGDPVTIWVDETGSRVPAPPTSTDIALASGIAGAAVWGAAALACAAVLALARSRLDRNRYVAWERGFRRMTDGGDKHPRYR
ncbi:hypothetical protein BCA37_16835 [Mycobacterium sp. djl-10]|nr:hypothetical protein BCA37_16835 [Mycobacterium sp. djl-10]